MEVSSGKSSIYQYLTKQPIDQSASARRYCSFPVHQP
jgi:hypothetical protein